MAPLKTFMAQTMRSLFNYFIPIISVYLCKREREREREREFVIKVIG